MEGELAHVILGHLGLDAVTGAVDILDGVLDLISSWDVLPSVEECLLLHVPFTQIITRRTGETKLPSSQKKTCIGARQAK